MRRALPLVLLLLAVGLLGWLAQGGAGTRPRTTAGTDAPPRPGDVPDPLGAPAGAAGTAEGARAEPALHGRGEAVAETTLPEPGGGQGAGDLLLVGRVVDGRRRGVAGAQVLASGPQGQVVRGRADAGGHFALPWRSLRRRVDVVLWARAPDGRVAAGSFFLYPSTVGRWLVPTLTVADGVARTLEVSEGEEGVAGARVEVRASVDGGGFPRDLALLEEGVTDARGRWSTSRLPTSWVLFAIATTGDGRRATGVSEGTSPDVVRLALLAPDDLRVRAVDAATGQGVPGAVVTLAEVLGPRPQATWHRFLPPPAARVTDGEGRIALGPVASAWPLQVHATRHGYDAATTTIGDLAEAGEVVVALTPHAGASWELVAGERPVPAEGTRVTLRGLHLDRQAHEVPPTGSVKDGRLVVPGASPEDTALIAEAPDGSLAVLLGARHHTGAPPPVSFAAPRTLDVTVVKADGRPAPDVLLTLRTSGIYPTSASTDRRGRARFVGLPAARYDVQSVDDRLDSRPVDLTQGDGHLAIRLHPEYAIRLAMTLDGRAALPPELSVGHGEDVLLSQEEDAEQGVVHLRLRSRRGGEPGLTVTAPGYTAGAVVLGPPVAAGERQARVALTAAGVVLVTVSSSEGFDDVCLLRWDDAQRAWLVTQRQDVGVAFGRLRFEPVEPGRYRALDRARGVFSGEFDVRAGGVPATVEVDALRSGLVRGRVEVPEGHLYRSVRIERIDEGADPRDRWVPEEVQVADDGTFVVQVPGDRPIRLRAAHPDLDAVPDGEVVVVAPRDDVVLRFVAR